MMERKKSNRTRIVGLRFTPEEYATIESKFRGSTCRKLSDHIRKHLFDKPIVTTYRNQSLDDLMEETVELRTELSAIGNNINQIAKKLNTVRQIAQFRESILRFELEKTILFNKIDEIKTHTQKISEQWLQL
ncbi:plasmid mobilization protein [Flavobacterium sp. TMP13]|uniref:plasmid mobilization protein n=1 Tax=Flavobacterium sp. TMP13 TaxID=3425950 RepID=UPI003D78102D